MRVAMKSMRVAMKRRVPMRGYLSSGSPFRLNAFPPLGPMESKPVGRPTCHPLVVLRANKRTFQKPLGAPQAKDGYQSYMEAIELWIWDLALTVGADHRHNSSASTPLSRVEQRIIIIIVFIA